MMTGFPILTRVRRYSLLKHKWGGIIFSVRLETLAENLTPAELRKLKNKQRKKAKKEAQQKEKAKQEEQAKKEPKQKAADAELDGPKEEELLPEKLAKVCYVLPHFLSAKLDA